jgi:6-phosphogluconolactonase
MYRMENGKINPEVASRAETLAEPNNLRARQAASTVHVHPNGRFVYGANRAEATTEFQGKQVFKGGENNIVVYSIDQTTGQPTPVQDGDAIKTVPAGLSVFRMGDDGKLTFVRKYDVDVGDKSMFWMGMVPL